MNTPLNLIIHCSATEAGQYFDASDIDSWHKARGFKGIGYHYVILLDGTVEVGRKENEIGAHCLGKNDYSIGICYIGGLVNKKATDTRTPEQLKSMIELIKRLMDKYAGIELHGHNEFANKACPCFDVMEWWRGVGDLDPKEQPTI